MPRLFLVRLLLAITVVPSSTYGDMLFVSSYSDNNIVKIGMDGTTSIFSTTSFAGPTGLAFNSLGILFVSIEGNNQIDATSGGTSSKFIGTGTGGPEGLAFDRYGNLYVAMFGPSTILKITPNGVKSVFISTGLNGPTGLAFDGEGNLYVANLGNDTIEKVSADGTGLSVFASLPSGHRPWGLAFDREGQLYVGNQGNSQILRFTPNGVGSLFSTAPAGTEGLAFDSAGNLYGATRDNIVRYLPDGSSSVFASSGLRSPTFIALTDDNGRPILPIPEPCSGLMLSTGFVLAYFQRSRKRE